MILSGIALYYYILHFPHVSMVTGITFSTSPCFHGNRYHILHFPHVSMVTGSNNVVDCKLKTDGEEYYEPYFSL